MYFQRFASLCRQVSSTMLEEIKTSHVHHLMTRLERMKENEIVCDFTIKVGNKSFPVHRTVLVSSSDYFEGIFSSNMEVREGFVDIKNLEVNVIEKSLGFMYTGSAKITMESVQEILLVADVLQLDGLKSLCFQFLLENMSPKNCLSVINLARTYNCLHIKEEAERIMVSDFEPVISSEMFPLISRSDLTRYISNLSYRTSWKAAITWAQDKEEFPQLVEEMDVKDFPFTFLLETVLEEPLIKKHESLTNLITRLLFSDAKVLKNNLDLDNCIDLRLLAQKHEVDDAMIDDVIRFMENYFEKIITTPRFCDISKDDVIRLLRSPETKSSSEKVKWEAALKWVKHEKKRSEAFVDLFSFIKLESFSTTFLKDIVRNEKLVEESLKCTNLLMDLFIKKTMELEAKLSIAEELSSTGGKVRRPQARPRTIFKRIDSESSVVMTGESQIGALAVSELASSVMPAIRDFGSGSVNIINEQPPNGEMTHFTIGENSKSNSWGAIEITYYFPAGTHQGIAYPPQQFTAYLPDYAEKARLRLKRAFETGAVFNVEHQNGQLQGQIVWGDIPHQTTMPADLANISSVMRKHLIALVSSLQAKGF